MRRLVCVILAVLLLAGCGSGEEEIRSISDDMDCDEVVEVVETAIERGTTYVALEEDDPGVSADLVFALSGAEARPECVEESVRSRAAGLRATLTGTGS
ncbi:hypothetical protein [Euzebya tangerina]|uniref:hypothetical protein n=1 Tax=Euzebya tangerina TaxID=591198 RepID=UPI000E30D1F2|nr:hypothetical protein [Euzebya tangerina]